MNQYKPENILIINLKYLGDLIVATPAVRAIKDSFPNAKISLLTRSEYKDVLKGNKNLDEIISYDNSIKKLKGFKKIISELCFIKALREKKYDAVISLQAGDRFVLWGFLSGARIRVAPVQNNLRILLTHKAVVYEDSISYMEYYLKVAESFGAKVLSKETEFYLDENFENDANRILSQYGITSKYKLIGIHPGASEPTKKWPLNKYLELIKLLNDKNDVKVILFTGPAEENIIESLKKSVGFSLADTSKNIQLLAWLISKCSLLICNDSGARHLSAALKIPTVTLFPQDKKASWKFYEVADKQFFLIGNRNTENPDDSFLDSISVADVFKKVEEILN